jgi:integrase/recombinase XerC
MNAQQQLPSPTLDDSAWQQALYAFLAEKERRSGSLRTVQSYSRMLADFFGRAGKPPDRVTSPDVLAWAHGVGLSGKRPSSVTIGARIACLSSFYRFLIRMGVLASNPCDALERPKVSPSIARGYSAEDVRRLLEMIPDTVPGRRDRAIVLTLVLTGRRRAEVLNLKAGDLSCDEGRAYYSYRGKGGKKGRRELPGPAYDAILATLRDAGKDLATMRPEESLWQAGAGERGVTSATFYSRLRRYQAEAGVGGSGVHILRHSAAKLRRDAGQTVEEVSAFLDHSSLAVTTTYLRRLEGVEDRSWGAVADAIGV